MGHFSIKTCFPSKEKLSLLTSPRICFTSILLMREGLPSLLVCSASQILCTAEGYDGSAFLVASIRLVYLSCTSNPSLLPSPADDTNRTRGIQKKARADDSTKQQHDQINTTHNTPNSRMTRRHLSITNKILHKSKSFSIFPGGGPC